MENELEVVEAKWPSRERRAAKSALEAFEISHWGEKYPAIAQSWRRN